MQSEDHEQTVIMNAIIATNALQRYFATERIAADGTKKTIAPKGIKTKMSGFERVKQLNLLTHFSNLEAAFDIIETATRVVKGVEKPYKESWKANLGKTLSKIAQHVTDDEKIRILDHHYAQQIDRNSHNKMKRYNKQQKLNAFKVLIEDPYKAYNGARSMEYAQGNVSQQMNERQTAAYQPHHRLLKKVIHALGRVNLDTAHGVSQFQFLVVALIYLLAYRNRRLDIADTRLVDGVDVNVVLREDGIFIKKTRKTYEPQVLLEFKDERLVNAVKTLVDIRRKQGKDRLFLKEDGDVALDVSKWFSERFSEVMKQLGIGENLNMRVFRMAYGIKLMQEHDGTLVSQKNIEDRMGHSWDVHLRRYALTPLDGEDVGDETEDEE
ncbi:hypothetical protein HK104_006261 [Borealophlyctis nickersoniae]|nr:hypothetical protein HK104_006261 [Borealophlyctis nickersoniae]